MSIRPTTVLRGSTDAPRVRAARIALLAGACYAALSVLGARGAYGALAADDGAHASASEVEVMLGGPTASNPVLPKPQPPQPRTQAPVPVENALAEEPPGAPTEARDGPNAGAIHLTAGVDFTNAYYWRGFRQEDRGFIAQPFASIGVDVWQGEEWALQAFVGTWNSVHDRATLAATTDEVVKKWYESDYYFGLSASVGKWTLSAQYNWYSSPSNAFTTVEEAQVTAMYNDADDLGAFALGPLASLAFETGEGTSDGQDEGVYLQLGVEPGVDAELSDRWTVRFSAPITLGLSLKDYFQDATGEDELFGYLSVGAKASAQLPVSDRYGTWKAYLSGAYHILGDSTSAINDNEDTAFAFAMGVSVAY
jgi:hypothetical protein